LGLSSKQMHEIIYSQFSMDNDIFDFRENNSNHISSVPIIQQSFYFLNRLKDVDSLKGTQKGNLPRAFVRELYHEFFSKDHLTFLPNNENDSVGTVRLRCLLSMAELIKKRANKFSLTKRGHCFLSDRNPVGLYRELFSTFANKLNWAYADLYPNFQLIQQSLLFNLLIIYKKQVGIGHKKKKD